MHLLERGFEQDLAHNVVQTLIRRKFLDDVRDATDYAQSRAAKGWGIESIRAHLASKGVEESTIDQALFGISETQVNQALQALEKCRKSPDTAKCARFLTSRGFDEDVIEQAIASYCRETGL